MKRGYCCDCHNKILVAQVNEMQKVVILKTACIKVTGTVHIRHARPATLYESKTLCLKYNEIGLLGKEIGGGSSVWSTGKTKVATRCTWKI